MLNYYSFNQVLIVSLITFAITGFLAVFSPFGIGFVLFSILRIKTKDKKLRKVSFIFQIVLCALTLVVGTLIGLLISIMNNELFLLFPVIIGLFLIITAEIGVIIWQSFLIKEKKSFFGIRR